MKKLNYLFVLGALVAGLAFTSCGGDDDPQPPSETTFAEFFVGTFSGTGTFGAESAAVSGTITVGADDTYSTTAGDLGLGSGTLAVSASSVTFTPSAGDPITASVVSGSFDPLDPTSVELTYTAVEPGAARTSVTGQYSVVFTKQ